MAAKKSFTTDRLVAERWCASSASDALKQRLLRDLAELLTPSVLRPLPDSLQLGMGDEALESWIAARLAESTVMTIRGKEDDSLLGLIILAQFEHPDRPTTIHLGYLFAEKVWGQGYASEMVCGLVDYFRQRSGTVQLLAGLENTNKASERVLQKAGFERIEEQSDNVQSMFGLVV